MSPANMTDLSLATLIAERDALNAKIEAVRAAERPAAIVQARALIERFGLTAMQVMPASPATTRQPAAKKAPAKYYDPDTGNTWSGRGRAPSWIKGKDATQFLIPAEGILRQIAQHLPDRPTN